MDSGICPWCNTVQNIEKYGKQHCQNCKKPVRVELDDMKNNLIQEQIDYWKNIKEELTSMETDLKDFGLTSHKMMIEVENRINRLTAILK